MKIICNKLTCHLSHMWHHHCIYFTHTFVWQSRAVYNRKIMNKYHEQGRQNCQWNIPLLSIVRSCFQKARGNMFLQLRDSSTVSFPGQLLLQWKTDENTTCGMTKTLGHCIQLLRKIEIILFLSFQSSSHLAFMASLNINWKL